MPVACIGKHEPKRQQDGQDQPHQRRGASVEKRVDAD
jgi:hypothetical protein